MDSIFYEILDCNYIHRMRSYVSPAVLINREIVVKFLEIKSDLN